MAITGSISRGLDRVDQWLYSQSDTTMAGLNKADQWLYAKTMPMAEKFSAFSHRSLGRGLAVGTGRGIIHLGRAVNEMSGAPYIGAAFAHYRKAASTRGFMPAANARYNPYLDKYMSGRLGLVKAHTGMLGRRAASAAGVMFRGIMPGMLLYYAAQDEMGFGMGLARESAGWMGLAVGGSIGLQMGGWAGATAGSAVGGATEGGIRWALGKIPGLKKTAVAQVGRQLGRTAGAFLGGPVGFIVGGLAMMEMARWGVGMALHTLPTFAKEFRSDMTTSGYGGDYVDTAGAITMRQRSLQAMGRSHTNARSALGQEASLLHV